MKNKLFRTSILIMAMISLLGVVAIFAYTYLKKPANSTEASAISPQDLAATQFVLDKMTTNLQGANFVQISLVLQADSKKAKDELDLRKAQVQDVVNSILHNTTKVDLDQPDGQEKLKQAIMKQVNGLLTEGKVTNIYITEIIVQ